MDFKGEGIEIRVEGMNCGQCAEGIEKRLKRLGLHDASVNYATASAYFTETSAHKTQDVIAEIEALGYQVPNSETKINKFHLEIKFLICLVFTLPLLMHMFVSWHILHNDIVQLLLCLPVFVIGFSHFGKSALSSLKIGTLNMDVLIVLGTSAAFIYSLTGTLFHLGEDFLFYESSASIITIVLFGNLLEKYSVKKTTSAIEELSKLQMITAKKITTVDNVEKIEELDSRLIHIGDILQVNSGDKIPTDGIIIWGDASIDESMISGESLPVFKSSEMKVVGGTLVIDGSIRIKATAIGKDTVLAQIIKMVRLAQTKKPDIQRLADRVSAVFVPFVLFIAVMTFIVAHLFVGISFPTALLQSIAVLVIACPCAMGLATPAAVMVGVGKAVKAGMLIKEGKTIERLANVKTIAFDKTGTLTDGVFKITKIEALNTDIEYLKSIIYSLEKHSSHPLAKSITAQLDSTKRLEFSEIKEEKGLGIRAKDKEGNTFSAGSYKLAENLTDDQSHNVYVIKNEQLIGWLDLQDQAKHGAESLIQHLHQLQIDTAIISGDSADKCQVVADKLGIKHFHAQKSPQEKLDIIDKMQEKGFLAFVGDGINDAPALSKASVGISLSSASEVAIQSAQVVLVGGKINQLADAIRISRKTLTIIKQNLFWAFSYNIVAIPIAAFGYLTPTVAAFAMAFSDVIIILNSLRLKATKI